MNCLGESPLHRDSEHLVARRGEAGLVESLDVGDLRFQERHGGLLGGERVGEVLEQRAEDLR